MLGRAHEQWIFQEAEEEEDGELDLGALQPFQLHPLSLTQPLTQPQPAGHGMQAEHSAHPTHP